MQALFVYIFMNYGDSRHHWRQPELGLACLDTVGGLVGLALALGLRSSNPERYAHGYKHARLTRVNTGPITNRIAHGFSPSCALGAMGTSVKLAS